MSDLRPLHSALKAIGNPTSKLTMLSNNINRLVVKLEVMLVVKLVVKLVAPRS